MSKSDKFIWDEDDVEIEMPTKEAAGLMGNFQKTDGAKLQTNPKVNPPAVDKMPFKQRSKKPPIGV